MVISISDFNKLSDKDKKMALQNMKQEVGVSGIVKEWGISRSKAYSMLREFNIPINKKAIRPSNLNKTDSKASSKTADKKEDPTSKKLAKSETDSPEDADKKADDSKFFLNLETQGTAPLINDTISALLGSGNFSDSSYRVNITIQEI
jgi:hypothetical protein